MKYKSQPLGSIRIIADPAIPKDCIVVLDDNATVYGRPCKTCEGSGYISALPCPDCYTFRISIEGTKGINIHKLLKGDTE